MGKTLVLKPRERIENVLVGFEMADGRRIFITNGDNVKNLPGSIARGKIRVGHESMVLKRGAIIRIKVEIDDIEELAKLSGKYDG